MKRTFVIVGIFFLIAIAVAGAYYWRMQKTAASGYQNGQPALPVQTITAGAATIRAELAETDAEQKTGLSGRTALQDGAGMLFVFGSDKEWGIWMPDMRFSIDILWADANGKILTIAANVSPQTYPTVFYPNAPSRYVLELPAGFAAAHGIRVGDMISLPASS